jgi:site-specific recombinase XerD
MLRQGAPCEALREILGHANIDGTQNILARAGGMSEWMRDVVSGRGKR